MAELIEPGPICDTAGIREAVCIHTRKIYDSCKDKDCVEDLRLYPTASSQAVIDRAISLKAGKAELLYAYIDVEPMGFHRGFYTVDVRYFYRVTADAFVGASRPVSVCGLAVFDKRAILFGSEGSAKVFASNASMGSLDTQDLESTNLPVAVVETAAIKGTSDTGAGGGAGPGRKWRMCTGEKQIGKKFGKSIAILSVESYDIDNRSCQCLSQRAA